MTPAAAERLARKQARRERETKASPPTPRYQEDIRRWILDIESGSRLMQQAWSFDQMPPRRNYPFLPRPQDEFSPVEPDIDPAGLEEMLGSMQREMQREMERRATDAFNRGMGYPPPGSDAALLAKIVNLICAREDEGGEYLDLAREIVKTVRKAGA